MRWFIVSICVLLAVVYLVTPPLRTPLHLEHMKGSKYRLRDLGGAACDYRGSIGQLPAGTLRDTSGQAVHGWQTTLLPMLDRGVLSDRIDMESPWDDPVNAPTFRTEIDAFLNPHLDRKRDDRGFAVTHFASNSHVVGDHQVLRLRDVEDGLSNTLLVGEVAERLQAWGHPRNDRDPSIGLNTLPQGFGATWRDGGVQFVFVDGSVRRLSDDTDPDVLRALATPAGGEAELQRRGLE